MGTYRKQIRCGLPDFKDIVLLISPYKICFVLMLLKVPVNNYGHVKMVTVNAKVYLQGKFDMLLVLGRLRPSKRLINWFAALR